MENVHRKKASYTKIGRASYFKGRGADLYSRKGTRITHKGIYLMVLCWQVIQKESSDDKEFKLLEDRLQNAYNTKCVQYSTKCLSL